MREQLFLQIVNRSIDASIAMAAVLCVRLLLRPLPRKYSYALWGVVPFRLFFTGGALRSVVSLIPSDPTPVPLDLALRTQTDPSGLPVVDQIVSSVVQPNRASAAVSMNPSQFWLYVLSWVWVLGICMLIFAAVLSVLRLRHSLRTATRIQDDIYETDRISSPFVLGFFPAKIYLPVGLSPAQRTYVLAHERAHLRRRDHWIKPLACCAVVLHWFNPLVWLCCALAFRDMEVSCDEAVLRSLEGDCRADYAAVLLALAETHAGLLHPLAFGESDAGVRIKNILRWRAPRRWMTLCGITALLLMIMLCACRQTDIGIIGGADGSTTIIVSEGAPPSTGAKSEKDASQAVGEPRVLTPQVPVLTADQPLGADGPVIDWTDGDTVIFHDYFGLFVVDLNRSEVLAALDLAVLGCDATQGDDYCEVRFSPDRQTIYLHPLSQPYRFAYRWRENSLRMEQNDPDTAYYVNPYAESAPPADVPSPYDCFKDGCYAYLVSDDWTVGTLCYTEYGTGVQIPLFPSDSSTDPL